MLGINVTEDRETLITLLLMTVPFIPSREECFFYPISREEYFFYPISREECNLSNHCPRNADAID